MIREGIVKDKKNGMLQVCFERPEACEKCGACAGSAHNHMTSLRGEAEIGDRVAVDMPDSKVFGISLLVYAVPLVFLLIGLLAGEWIFENDLICALCGIGLMAMSYVILHFTDQKIGRKQNFQPQIIAVVPGKKGEDKHE